MLNLRNNSTLCRVGEEPRRPLRLDRSYIRRLLREKLAFVIAEYVPHHSNWVLVDFGCGNMPYRPLLEPRVARYVALDLPGNPLADQHVSADGTTGLRDDFADFVLSTQVLEHVGDPLEYLRECYRILKPGGLLLLSTHGYWMYHPDPQDYWRWCSSGLKKVVSDRGFQIIQWEGVMGLAATGIQLLQDALMPRMPLTLKDQMAAISQSLMQLVDGLQSQKEKNTDACVFVLLARK